ncbi:MAG: hypothetical protein LBV14_17165, partial [Acidovorax sp.]|jgi:hypothetical protein|nr:hypothetical protein [Acidovorax sp.]
VELYGPGSDPYRKAQQRAKRRVMHLAKSGRKALEDRTADERSADVADLLASITVRFDGFDVQGRGLPEALRVLYADPKAGYIADQVNDFSADWANFLPSAPQS